MTPLSERAAEASRHDMPHHTVFHDAKDAPWLTPYCAIWIGTYFMGYEIISRPLLPTARVNVDGPCADESPDVVYCDVVDIDCEPT